jgi:hypothetical protein
MTACNSQILSRESADAGVCDGGLAGITLALHGRFDGKTRMRSGGHNSCSGSPGRIRKHISDGSRPRVVPDDRMRYWRTMHEFRDWSTMNSGSSQARHWNLRNNHRRNVAWISGLSRRMDNPAEPNWNGERSLWVWLLQKSHDQLSNSSKWRSRFRPRDFVKGGVGIGDDGIYLRIRIETGGYWENINKTLIYRLIVGLYRNERARGDDERNVSKWWCVVQKTKSGFTRVWSLSWCDCPNGFAGHPIVHGTVRISRNIDNRSQPEQE